MGRPIMSEYQWDKTFCELFDRCEEKYRSGNHDFETYYSEADLEFLRSIGYKKREFFDFVEDFVDYGEPTLSTAVLIADVRRNYLTHMMDGNLSEKEIAPSSLPPKSAELAGVRWLPRIIMKAQGKLRGELHPDIMYLCGGDRDFLRKHGIAPADFLRVVWEAGDNEGRILDFVKNR